MRYITLLRGVNVSGNNLKIADLVKSFQSLGFQNIKTYIQSGNVIFDYESTNTRDLENIIERNIEKTFALPVKTIIRIIDEFESIIDGNPFLKEKDIDLDKLHVTLLSDVPESGAVSALDIKKDENERFAVISREIYLYCPNGYGRTKLNNATFERKLKTVATTRNWSTMNKLLEISKQDQ